jgi:hypothetical protein
MARLRSTVSRQYRTLDKRLNRQMAELVTLAAVRKDNGELANFSLMAKAHNINCDKLDPVALFPGLERLYYERNAYLFNVENTLYYLQKLGRNTWTSKIRQCYLKGTRLFEKDKKGQFVELSDFELAIDFKECKRNIIKWSDDPLVAKCLFRVLIFAQDKTFPPKVK